MIRFISLFLVFLLTGHWAVAQTQPLALGTVITYKETSQKDANSPAEVNDVTYEILEHVKSEPEKNGILTYQTKVGSPISGGWPITQWAYFGYSQTALDACETADLSEHKKSFTVAIQTLETVTVPAGTFKACHMHLERTGLVMDSWDTPEHSAGNVKYKESRQNGASTLIELKSIELKK